MGHARFIAPGGLAHQVSARATTCCDLAKVAHPSEQTAY
jgi:hypothetical protein